MAGASLWPLLLGYYYFPSLFSSFLTCTPYKDIPIPHLGEIWVGGPLNLVAAEVLSNNLLYFVGSSDPTKAVLESYFSMFYLLSLTWFFVWLWHCKYLFHPCLVPNVWDMNFSLGIQRNLFYEYNDYTALEVIPSSLTYAHQEFFLTWPEAYSSVCFSSKINPAIWWN